jgi:CubicO group peptidase (beta-lactamase class C family)
MQSMVTSLTRTSFIIVFISLFVVRAAAHNGSIAHAYPLNRISIDGDLSDWPKDIVRYQIGTFLSDERPNDKADFSGFFQLGYRMEDRSLYIAFSITDDDFVEDTSADVKWNTQDGLELSIDPRHLLTGSGVASFMYSAKLRNINKAFYDPFVAKASWDMMEVIMKRNGNQRIYEWRIALGDQLVSGKSIGLDFLAFDRDKDGSFTFAGWGRGESKYMLAGSLGDVMLLPTQAKLVSLSGTVQWQSGNDLPLPKELRFVPKDKKMAWFETALDSMGRYSLMVPEGTYDLVIPDRYIFHKDKLYATSPEKPLTVFARTGKSIAVPNLVISSAQAPHLIPEKGILHSFNPASLKQLDAFINTYRDYYNIPGVSLALIRDGNIVYHKTYGVKNSMSGEKVDASTLFEAASVTKPVFAFAVQRLAERDVIDLDKPLYQYLPYDDIAHDEKYKLITARHVLTHRTGFPNWRWMNADSKLDLKFTPGTSYGYSGEGFEYLKMVVEKITGKKVEQVLKEEVIEPMELYHTFFSKNDSLVKTAANGHYDGMPTEKQFPDAPGMAYSMHTEAKIFTRFMIYLLEQKGLKPAMYDTMLSKHSDFTRDPGDPVPKIPAYMGMSLEIRETPFGKSFGHGGNNGDFKCKFEVYKEAKMGYVIFTNSNTSDVLLKAIRMFLVEGYSPD